MAVTGRMCEMAYCEQPAALRIHLAWELSDGSGVRDVQRDYCADDAAAKHDEFIRPGDLFQVVAVYDKETDPVTVEPATIPRSIKAIAADIRAAWTDGGKEIYFGAVPYLEALETLDTIEDKYVLESGESMVLRFLTNASTFRGKRARELKAELKALLPKH